MSRNWRVALLIAAADLLVAGFWPGPVNGLTVLSIVAVAAVLWLALIAVPNVRAANREVRWDLAAAQRRGDERAANERLVYTRTVTKWTEEL